MGVHRTRIIFPEPETVELIEEPLPDLAATQVQVRTHLSAVSPGTEALLYQGDVPDSMGRSTAVDSVLEDLTFPVSPGYSCVGRIEKVGDKVDDKYCGRLVFSFQPHASSFVSSLDELVLLPAEISVRDAVLIPNVETAVNLVMDGRPMIGETIIIFGQGVVGVLTLALVDKFPLQSLYTVEPDSSRRSRSESWGAQRSFDPNAEKEALLEALQIAGNRAEEATGPQYEGADLVYELSGTPSALNDAISAVGFDGRIIVGSWYGTNRSPLDLGGRFHRSRIQITSSQVSTIDPVYRGRWTKDRRMQVVLDSLDDLHPGSLISSAHSLSDAPTVYEQLAGKNSGVFQPVFEYE